MIVADKPGAETQQKLLNNEKQMKFRGVSFLNPGD